LRKRKDHYQFSMGEDRVVGEHRGELTQKRVEAEQGVGWRGLLSTMDPGSKRTTESDN